MERNQPLPRTALVIAHEPDSVGGQVTVRLTERGFDVTTHIITHDYEQPNVSDPIPDFADFDLVAIMGSLRSVTNKDEISTWIHDEVKQVRSAHAGGQPMLGVCFGGQLLADALGGSVEVSPITEIGWFEIRTANGAQNPAGPGPWMEWHHDRFHPPAEAEILAETDASIQLFRLGRSVGTQFHPEVDESHIAGWLANVSDDYLREYGQDRAALLEDARANEQRNIEQCHAFVDWFVDTVAFPDEMSDQLLSRSTP